MAPTETPINLVEVGGRGGVFQHALAVAVALASSGRKVVLHTSTDPEIVDARVEYCRCFDWFRGRRLRSVRIGARFVTRTIPHLIRSSGPIWVQGLFKTPLTFLALLAFRLTGCGAAFSPHNLFSRHGGAVDRLVIRLSLAAAKRIVVYNGKDAEQLSKRRHVFRVPLLMYSPRVSPEVLDRWRTQFKQRGIVASAVGQIREDKNLEMLVEAAAESHVGVLIMGQDLGALKKVLDTRARLKATTVSVLSDYYPLEDIAAVVALSSAIALPYSVASQSGVAALARAYGTPILAFAVGGLEEQADVLVTELTPQAWAAALQHLPPKDLDRVIREPSGPSTSQIANLQRVTDGLSR
jgi:glycosyltransferase involved in cell wall biosynthesis